MQGLLGRLRQLWRRAWTEPDWSAEGPAFPFNDAAARALGRRYCFSPAQVCRLDEVFRQLDTDCMGAVSPEELAALIGEAPGGLLCEYLRAVVEAATPDPDGRLDFCGWASAMAELALLDEEGLARLVFRMLDWDDDELICAEDLIRLGEQLHPGAQLYDHDALDLGLRVPFEHFFERREKFALLLFPAHEVQARVQAVLFGEGFWRRWAHKARQATGAGAQAAGAGPRERGSAREAGHRSEGNAGG